MKHQTHLIENVHPSFKDFIDYFAQPFRCFSNNTKNKGLFKIDFEKVLHGKRHFYLNSEEIELLKIKKNSQENIFYQFFKKYENSNDLSIVTKYRETNNDFLNYLNNIHGVLQVMLKRKYLIDFNEFLIILKSNKSVNKRNEIQNNDADFNIDLNHSKVFKSLFITEELFEKFDFTALKEKGIIYNQNSEELKLNLERVPSDLVILMIQLIRENIIRVKYGDEYLNEISNVAKSIGVNFDVSYISKLFKSLQSGKKISSRNLEVLENIKEFISQYH